MFNKVILIGNLTREIELRYTPSGTAVAKVGIASNRSFTDPVTKEKKTEVMFIDIIIFGRAAETANQYLKKGSQILVEGRLSFKQWTDNTGQKRSKHEIIAESVKFLGAGNNSANNQTQTAQNQQPQYQSNNPQTQPSQSPEMDINEEDIPF